MDTEHILSGPKPLWEHPSFILEQGRTFTIYFTDTELERATEKKKKKRRVSFNNPNSIFIIKTSEHIGSALFLLEQEKIKGAKTERTN